MNQVQDTERVDGIQQGENSAGTETENTKTVNPSGGSGEVTEVLSQSIREARYEEKGEEDITLQNDADEGAENHLSSDERTEERATPQYEREDWNRTVTQFMEQNPVATQFSKELAQELLEDPVLAARGDCLEAALLKVLSKAYRSQTQLLNDEAFRAQIVGNESIRSQVIAEYLRGLQNNRPPQTMNVGGQYAISPQDRIDSIEAAGRVMKKMLNNRRNSW